MTDIQIYSVSQWRCFVAKGEHCGFHQGELVSPQSFFDHPPEKTVSIRQASPNREMTCSKIGRLDGWQRGFCRQTYDVADQPWYNHETNHAIHNCDHIYIYREYNYIISDSP